MRILVATGIYPPESGGPATYAKLLHDELPKRGFEVDVLPFREVLHLPKVLRHIAYAFKVLGRGRHADIVYAQDTMSVGVPVRFANVFLRKPLFLRVPGDHVWEQGTQRYGIADTLDLFPVWSSRWPLVLKIMRALQLWVVRGAHTLVVPSAYVGTIVERWGVASGRINVIYSGIRIPVPAQLPQGAQLPDTPRIITVARLVPWKGIDALIDVTKNGSWNLMVGDDGPLRENLEERARSIGVADRVHFVGRLPHEAMMGYIAEADVFVLNSTYEGLSHLLIEAMALGVPVVATRVGGNPELVDERSGILVPPGDAAVLAAALARLVADPELRRAMGDAARARAAQFSIDQSLDKLAALFNLCSSRPL